MVVQRRPAARTFRRFLYCVLGTVLGSYVLLFGLVVSRHFDEEGQDGGKHKANSVAARASQQTYLDLVDKDRRGVVSRLVAMGAVPILPRRTVRVCLRPRYRVPPGPVAALASFPGSGNTWLRFLVQQVTGYLTGSVYKDNALLRNGFPAENVVNGSVVLVKTHEWGPLARRPFQRAVLLLRDPYSSLLAEFNRRSGGHLGHASADKFHKGKAWPEFVAVQSRSWAHMALDWLQFDGPLLVVRYEDVIANLSTELTRVVSFLNITVAWPTFQCVLHHRDGIFRRPRKPLNFDPFGSAMRKAVDKYKDIVEKALEMHAEGQTLQLQNLTRELPNMTENISWISSTESSTTTEARGILSNLFRIFT